MALLERQVLGLGGWGRKEREKEVVVVVVVVVVSEGVAWEPAQEPQRWLFTAPNLQGHPLLSSMRYR